MLKTCMICMVAFPFSQFMETEKIPQFLYQIVTFTRKLEINPTNNVFFQGLEDDGDERVKVDSIAALVFVLFELSLTIRTNSNNNLMMRHPGLSR